MVTEEDESESEESNARYELNTTYRLTSAGRQGRAIHRQVAELEAEAEQQAWAEDVLSEQQLRSDIADALEDQNSRLRRCNPCWLPGSLTRFDEQAAFYLARAL